MEIKVFHDLKSISKEEWSQLVKPSYPFHEYDYLLALEEGNCTGTKTGWFPCYITAWENQLLVGVTFLYIKNHSYGEYIFDWEWANAYSNHKIEYYPKVVSAVPFTPATTHKLLIHPEAHQDKVAEYLIHASLDITKKLNCSSSHFLFIHPDEIHFFQKAGFSIRHSYQYHWKNQNYESFDHFLSHLKGKRRKEILRERKKVFDSNIKIKILTGNQLKREHSHLMYRFYQSTIDKKNAISYLSIEFFEQIFESMRNEIVLFLAESQGKWVAGSINYHKDNHLYGRYWGCVQDFQSLHFELCYYQTIEYAIQHNIQLFEAGAQGEHKIKRGFLPELTYSAHWIEHSGFRPAIQNFIEQEKLSIQEYFHNTQKHHPFKEI
ncbi:MAG: putative N-acyltransferase [bacterium]|jgi:predicted N-acyltransferase